MLGRGGRTMAAPAYVCPRCKTGIPFGTSTQPPPTRCPGCQKPLGIPTALDPIPPIAAICPICTAEVSLNGYYAGGPCECPACKSIFTAPGKSPFEKCEPHAKNTGGVRWEQHAPLAMGHVPDTGSLLGACQYGACGPLLSSCALRRLIVSRELQLKTRTAPKHGNPGWASRASLVEPCRVRHSLMFTSPACFVIRAANPCVVMPALMNRTEPSARSAFTPVL